MIPLKDDVPSRSFPLVMFGLLAANLAVFFLYQLPASAREQTWQIWIFGVVPARLLAPPFGPDLYTLVTSQFFHGGLLHLAGNMLALYIFADNVEDRFGHVRFLLFYLASGVVANGLQIATNSTSGIPAIGASGAIGGVLGAYLVLYPGARVSTLVPLVFIPWIVRVPAVLWLGLWFVSQLGSGLATVGEGSGEEMIAYWAHVGGFATGVVMGIRFRARR